ncbi:MAG: hypothetical protein JWN89_527 [Parcubacteria group bacterium]|nr:hypothetical protein [Parcubacteria group bacterium]
MAGFVLSLRLIENCKLLPCLRSLGSVSASRLASLVYALGVEKPSNDGIADSEVLDASSADNDHRVLLEVVAHARDVGGHFRAVREADTGDLSDSRVRLLWGLGGHLGADASLERRVKEYGSVLDGIEPARQSDRLGFLGGLGSLSFD